jgi:dihydrofolate reductase
MLADEGLHRHAVENLARADALLFGRVTYEMMESAWRPPARTGARPEWMEPFARTIDAAKKYVVSSTETCRLEARGPAGARLGGGGAAV